MSKAKTITQYWWTAEQLRAAGWEQHRFSQPDLVFYAWRRPGVGVAVADGVEGGAWLTDPPPPPELSDEEIEQYMLQLDRHLGDHVAAEAWGKRVLRAAVRDERRSRLGDAQTLTIRSVRDAVRRRGG